MGNVWPILIAVFVLLDLAVLVGVFVWLGRRTQKGRDNAPGWYVFCVECGRTRRLSEVGGTTIAATPRNVRTRAGCSGCGSRGTVRRAHIKKMSPEELAVVEAYEASGGHSDPNPTA